jgi:hypothetical protein
MIKIRYFSKFDVKKQTEIEKRFKVEEVKIKLPWGHVAGKWWGPKDVQPIVTLHGWQGIERSLNLQRHTNFIFQKIILYFRQCRNF